MARPDGDDTGRAGSSGAGLLTPIAGRAV